MNLISYCYPWLDKSLNNLAEEAWIAYDFQNKQLIKRTLNNYEIVLNLISDCLDLHPIRINESLINFLINDLGITPNQGIIDYSTSINDYQNNKCIEHGIYELIDFISSSYASFSS